MSKCHEAIHQAILKEAKPAAELQATIEAAGGELFIVGGAVRDEALEKEAADIDFLVTGVEVADMPFDKVAGSDFPVFLVEVDGETCEVALARTERKEGKGYHGFSFNSSAKTTVEEDLSRRDLTINAMAKNLRTGEIIDPFGGMEDLKNGVIRHVSDAFAEDPTRVYRVARFAARFGFKVAVETMALIASMKKQLAEITAERVGKELEKVMKCNKPSVFFQVLKEADLLDVHFAAVAALDVPDKHDGTAFNHTMQVVDAADNAMDRFALLCHDFGKGITPKKQHPSHHNHDTLGVDVVTAFCDSLRLPNLMKKAAVSAAKNHMKVKVALEMKASTLVKFVGTTRDIESVLRVSRIDSTARDGANVEAQNALFNAIELRVATVQNVLLVVTGKTLISSGVKPGKLLGEKLHQARVEAVKKLLKK